jgi:hypothetical protein
MNPLNFCWENISSSFGSFSFFFFFFWGGGTGVELRASGLLGRHSTN